ncbi:MAG: biotin transporter BioY [Chloroflexi bacterium]|jgi:biotin transport system substrate-specific component|nr:biotin transporter BioY [Chloroflexota bacterium]
MHSYTLRRVNISTYIKILGVLLFAVATGVSARISVPLPFSPVPLTLQVLVVILSGFVLGARGALVSQVLYLQAILLGAPLTAYGLAGPAAFVSPTAGYLVAFPVAAAVAGWLSHRSESRRPAWRALGGLAGLAVVYGVGVAWLSGYAGGLRAAWTLGVAPFLGVDLLKLVVATAVLSVRGR